MLVEQFDQILPLDEEERRGLAALEREPARVFRPGEDLYSPDEPVLHALLIRRGWAAWQDILPDGSRQVFTFYLPGDIAGLPWAVVEENQKISDTQFSIDLLSLHLTALTEVQAVTVTSESLSRIFRHNPAISLIELKRRRSLDRTNECFN